MKKDVNYYKQKLVEFADGIKSINEDYESFEAANEHESESIIDSIDISDSERLYSSVIENNATPSPNDIKPKVVEFEENYVDEAYKFKNIIRLTQSDSSMFSSKVELECEYSIIVTNFTPSNLLRIANAIQDGIKKYVTASIEIYDDFMEEVRNESLQDAVNWLDARNELKGRPMRMLCHTVDVELKKIQQENALQNNFSYLIMANDNLDNSNIIRMGNSNLKRFA
jgi:hypothetical protein